MYTGTIQELEKHQNILINVKPRNERPVACYDPFWFEKREDDENSSAARFIYLPACLIVFVSVYLCVFVGVCVSVNVNSSVRLCVNSYYIPLHYRLCYHVLVSYRFLAAVGLSLRSC